MRKVVWFGLFILATFCVFAITGEANAVDLEEALAKDLMETLSKNAEEGKPEGTINKEKLKDVSSVKEKLKDVGGGKLKDQLITGLAKLRCEEANQSAKSIAILIGIFVAFQSLLLLLCWKVQSFRKYWKANTLYIAGGIIFSLIYFFISRSSCLYFATFTSFYWALSVLPIPLLYIAISFGLLILSFKKEDFRKYRKAAYYLIFPILFILLLRVLFGEDTSLF